MQQVILASRSPYRKTLLSRLKFSFTTQSPNIDESAYQHNDPAQLARLLATVKAQTIAVQYPNAIIIGSDQIAVCQNTRLGKPMSHSNAIEQLQLLSGHWVTFHTGLCVINTQSQHSQSDTIDTKVQFRTLSLDTIQHYVTKENATDCAGAFKAEALGIALCQTITSDDPTALVGLPLIRLSDMLEATGFTII